MMYKTYFYCICVTSVVVYGNGDDTKYIDLLPEAEKEEFLNRIARRIIEEIHSKDSPEQSHTEVSDDQLNAHDTYVQDLIKEESENLRKERRSIIETESVKNEADDADIEKDSKQHNHVGLDANNQHIDLTIRNNKQTEKNNRNQSDDSTFDVIPVKVIYDQENYKSTLSPTNISDKFDFTTRNSERKDDANIKNLNDSRPESVTSTSPLVNLTEEKETTSQSNIKSTQSVTQVSEDQSDFISNKDIQILASNKQNLSHDSVENSTPILFSTDTLRKGNNNKNDNSFENKERTTQIYITSNKNTELKDSSPTESKVKLSDIDTTMMPLTTQMNTNHNSDKPLEHENLSSTKIYVTTVKTTMDEPYIKSEISGVHKEHSSEEKGEIKTKKDTKNMVKKNLRTRLEIFSQEYNLEKRPSHEKNNKKNIEKGNEKKNIRQYFVYEIPKKKSVFVEVKDRKRNEEPYVVPIYNFAPENAYYNAHNRFGLNNNEGDKVVPDQFDQELYLRSGFKFDINPKKPKNRKTPHGEWMKHPRHSHWEHVLQSKLEHNPLFIDYQDDENLGSKINLKQQHKEKNDLSKIPAKIVYVPLRKHGLYDDKEVSPKKINKGYFDFKSPNPTENDHVRAVKNFLYRQQKFGYLSPSRVHNFPRSNQRVLDYDLKIDNNRKLPKKPKIDIELDYYFGNKLNNETNAGNSNEEYFDIEDITARHQISGADEKNSKIDNIKHYRMETKDDCKHGCIEMDLETPSDNFYNNLETLIKVLQDMIYRDRTDLVNYDWLLSTIDLKSAIMKLIDLTDTIEKGNKIHPLDLKLLNYVVYLYNKAMYKLENTIHTKHETKAFQDINNIVNSFVTLLRRRIRLPKNKNKPGKKLTDPVQFWYKHYIRVGMGSADTNGKKDQVLRSFKRFLNDLDDNMFELHDALKHIALITTYPKQNWYKDLKDIYLKSASKKELLQVILHLAASRLFSSIEETAKKAEEDELYKNKNAEEVRRIQDEFIFVLRILERIMKTQ